MVNYQLGKIYTVRSLTSSEIYVGSTVAPLCKRMAKHRSDWKRGKILGRNKEIVSDINEWFIELYENYPCNKLEELAQREGVIIRKIGTLNKNIAGRTAKEYRIENVDKLKEYIKHHRIENADKIKEQKKQYYIENIDKLKEQKKQYFIENADKIIEQKKQYYIENADKIKEWRIHNVDKIKQYRIENADKIKEQKKQYYLKNKLAKSQTTTK